MNKKNKHLDCYTDNHKVQEKEKITKNDFLFIFRKSFFLFHIRDIFSYLLFHTDNVLVKLLS